MTQFDLSFLVANSAQEDWWEIILCVPEFALSAIFIWAEGYILSILFCQSKRVGTFRNNKLFHLAIGIVWTSIFLLAYSYIKLGGLPTTAEELRAVALPCAIISSSVTLCVCLYVLMRDYRSKIPDPPAKNDKTSMSKKNGQNL